MTERNLTMKRKREAIEKKLTKKPLENINSFLYKLWSLVNDDTIPSIHWSHDGEKVVIENPTKFTAKVLASSDKQLFKTNNISSFIRQLNLYGFRRVKENCGKVPLIFQHGSFKRGRPDLLVDVKRKRSTPMKQPVPLAGRPLSTAKGRKPNIQQSQVHAMPGFPSYPTIPTSQAYSYLNNTTAVLGKNAPMPFGTPFAVNHGPTFINLGSQSTILSKPRIQESGVSKDEETKASSAQKSDGNDLHNLKVANEPLLNPWQQTACYNTMLQDHKTFTATNSLTHKALMQMQGNSHKYPAPTYFNSTMLSVPQLGYRNYGDPGESVSYQNLQNHALPINPYHPFSPFHAPPFLKPISLPSSPQVSQYSPKMLVKTASPMASPTSLESFSIFSSRMPKTDMNENINGLTADEEKKCDFDEKE
ncbi:uncharacterized protein LOC114527325 [Dendronephthya gigantea]|uniref:uncharacterized protein LOC114527325 n=1 Tax=Dendronephthya gigantea TaxID=151771 RepID=UPI00106B75ED|nr:uncharacterized protein LOC114527325 [Dendronephthya gigantea]